MKETRKIEDDGLRMQVFNTRVPLTVIGACAIEPLDSVQRPLDSEGAYFGRFGGNRCGDHPLFDPQEADDGPCNDATKNASTQPPQKRRPDADGNSVFLELVG